VRQNQVTEKLPDMRDSAPFHPVTLSPGYPVKHPAWRLVAVCVFWGMSFPLIKWWNRAAVNAPDFGYLTLASLTLIGVRYSLATAILLAYWPQAWRRANRDARRSALAIAAVYLAGSSLQVIGLQWTTPASSAFLTSLGGAWVPLLLWCWRRTPVHLATWLGLALAISGVFVLALPEDGGSWTFGKGELLTLAASVLFSVQILMLDHHGRTVPPVVLTIALVALNGPPVLLAAALLAAAGGGVAPWLRWTSAMLTDPMGCLVVLALIFFCTILAFHWMNKYQPQVPANRAALIYFLEPLFGAAFSLALGYDQWSYSLFLGGGLIIAGNLLAERARL
jgi:drug/metabolite transporter (DMT)-like permease